MLLAVICLLALMMIALAVAAPRIAASIQRDREVETMHRGLQYTRAIQLYYRKFQRYPPNVDALVMTNEIRFLRKKYLDPTTGKDDWKPLMFGQNKTPMAMGFFGQPLGGLGGGLVAGTGPSGGNGVMGASSIGGGMGSSFGSSPGAPGSSPGTPAGTGTTDSTAGGGTGTPTPGGTDASGNAAGGGTAFGGQTFGGGGIIGVTPASPKPSILTYKKKNHYNEWEFLYSPLMDQQAMGGSGIGTPNPVSPPGVGAPGVGTQTGSGFGFSPTTGTSPTSPTTPTPAPTPQQ